MKTPEELFEELTIDNTIQDEEREIVRLTFRRNKAFQEKSSVQV